MHRALLLFYYPAQPSCTAVLYILKWKLFALIFPVIQLDVKLHAHIIVGS